MMFPPVLASLLLASPDVHLPIVSVRPSVDEFLPLYCVPGVPAMARAPAMAGVSSVAALPTDVEVSSAIGVSNFLRGPCCCWRPCCCRVS